MPSSEKGSDFERDVCKRLSRWWSNDKQSDIFWRTSQSGGRATQRSKKGERTFGSYGDVAAVNPFGSPLLDVFTIELKRGRSHSHPGDLLDFKAGNEKHPWVVALMQAMRSQRQAGSLTWMMICKRDFRAPVVYLESRIFAWLRKDIPVAMYAPVFRFNFSIKKSEDDPAPVPVSFVGMPLEVFLKGIKPKQIIERLKELT